MRPTSWLAAASLAVLAGVVPFSAEAGLAKTVQMPVWSAPAQTAGTGPGIPAAEPASPSESDVPPAAPAAEAPAEPAPPPSPCAVALEWVNKAGLPLPSTVDYNCPSTQFPHQGAACWNGTPCPGRGFVAINMDRLNGTSDEYLLHVVAHEVCHILEFQATGASTEASADACAAAHGAPA